MAIEEHWTTDCYARCISVPDSPGQASFSFPSRGLSVPALGYFAATEIRYDDLSVLGLEAKELLPSPSAVTLADQMHAMVPADVPFVGLEAQVRGAVDAHMAHLRDPEYIRYRADKFSGAETARAIRDNFDEPVVWEHIAVSPNDSAMTDFCFSIMNKDFFAGNPFRCTPEELGMKSVSVLEAPPPRRDSAVERWEAAGHSRAPSNDGVDPTTTCLWCGRHFTLHFLLMATEIPACDSVEGYARVACARRGTFEVVTQYSPEELAKFAELRKEFKRVTADSESSWRTPIIYDEPSVLLFETLKELVEKDDRVAAICADRVANTSSLSQSGFRIEFKSEWRRASGPDGTRGYIQRIDGTDYSFLTEEDVEREGVQAQVAHCRWPSVPSSVPLPACECGALKAGCAAGMAGHSPWCPAREK